MYGTIAQDLAILGCSENSTWDDIKAAYRAMARRLHGELQRQAPGANARLVDVNTAYDRLTSGWAHRPSRPAQPSREVAIDAALRGRLRTALEKAAFKIAFDASRNRETGAYADPRRLKSAHKPATVAAVKVVRDGADITIHLDQPLEATRTLLAVPELVLTQDGGLEIGTEIRVIDFSLRRSARQIRIDPDRLRTRGDMPARCVIVQP